MTSTMEPKSDQEIGIVIAGSVDSGKSSTIGVLISDTLDDGRGSARAKVAIHPHEIETGQTSDISTRNIASDGKNIVLIDLCGHEKYLKTTTFGITGYFPDYAIITVASNRGILKMTREHLGILFYMQIPTIILITRIDIAPVDIYNSTVGGIKKICNLYGKKAFFVNSLAELSLDPVERTKVENTNYGNFVNMIEKMKTTDTIIPIITTSNKTGFYMDTFKKMLFSLEPRNIWSDISTVQHNTGTFYVDNTYTPVGIGLVVSGIMRGKTIKVNDTMYIGPIDNKFIQVRIRSIHNNIKQSIAELNHHHRGCFAIAPVDKKIELGRKNIMRGTVLVTHVSQFVNLKATIKCEIEILHHSALIQIGYSPVLHIGTIRQSASVSGIYEIKQNNTDDYDSKTNLKTRDKAIVDFTFCYNHGYVESGMIFFFREGTTRGVGKIL